MGLVTKTYTFSAGAVIVAAEHNTDFDTLYNVINGNLSNENIASNAAIVDTKLDAITTAGKVSGAALTSLSSIPSGAGDIPSANLDGNAVVLTGDQTVAGIKTFSSLPVLPAGTPSGNQAASASYVASQVATVTAIGTRASKSAGTSYQAATDGFVQGYCTVSGTGLDIKGYTDASNPPTTQVMYAQFGSATPTICQTFCFPVKKNHYYKLVNSDGTLNVYDFVPLGT